MKRIDFEAHYYTQSFLDAASNRSGIPSYDPETRSMYHGGDGLLPIKPIVPELLDLGEERIKRMDEAGIDMAMLSISIGIEQLPAEIGVREAVKNHDLLYEAMKKYPGRFGGCAVLAVADIGASLAELERCGKELGFRCWNAFSNYGDKRLDDEYFFPLLKKAAELGMYVYIHPTFPTAVDLHGYGAGMAGSGFGFALDVATTLIRMIFNGVFDRIPDLKVMIGHLGEGIPFLMQRLDDANSRMGSCGGKARNMKAPSEYFSSNIWVSTSGNFSKAAFECAKTVFGMDHIVFGTDYPMERMEENITFINSLPLPMTDFEKLYFGNAETYFGIKV